MEVDFLFEEDEFWRCRKHPSTPRSGVCPSCLRDRLLRLCPDCANVRPCSCFPTSSSSSSSFSSRSSFDPPRSSVSAGIGAVGRVSNLIESEPAFRRSKSAAFPFRRPRSDAVMVEDGEREVTERPAAVRRWFWPFSKAAKEEEARISRSRSVGVAMYSDSRGAENGRLKGWKWYFPSPMRAFRHRKSAKIVQDRPPLCRA